jgi:hypothetical protein
MTELLLGLDMSPYHRSSCFMVMERSFFFGLAFGMGADRSIVVPHFAAPTVEALSVHGLER